MNTHDELRSALQRGASGVGEDQLLTLDDVKGRARGLRRRRAALAGVATLAVVALAVPVGLSVGDGSVTGPEIEPAAPTETVAPPADTTDVLLTTARPLGEVPPGIDYLHDDEIQVAGTDETSVVVGPWYYGTAPLGDGWVALRSSDDGEALDVLDAGGRVIGSHPAAGGLALSPDGTVLAYGAPGGRIMTLVAGGEPTQIYDGDGAALPVAVAGSKSCDNESDGGGCAVWFNNEAGREAMTVTTKGIVGGVEGVQVMADVSADGRVTGIVSADDFGSCSALLGVDGKPAWETCDHTLGEFSPDGRYVLGYPAYRDGGGDSSIAILDAQTGDVVAEASRGESGEAFLAGARWDVDGTVLMPVYEDDTWALMRFTPDGLLVRAVERDFDAPDPYEPSLTLAVTP
jgi:hypothetical protein